MQKAAQPKYPTIVVGEPYGELPAAIREEYTLVGWSVDGTIQGIVKADTTIDIGNNHTLTAVWERKALSLMHHSLLPT